MRDVLITIIVFGAIPFILSRPALGVMVWSWLGYMNPHRLTWGFAFNFPFSMIIGLVTIVSLLISSEKKRIPWMGLTVLLTLFVLWMNVTTYFSLNPDDSFREWDRTMKIMLMVYITLMVINTKERMHALVWTIVISLGFFGVKGGIFSILSGGNYRVWGPVDSFIQDNNTLALALIMTLPLMRYLHLNSSNRHVRRFLIVSMILTAVSILTSQSRGAFLAGMAMATFLGWNSRHRMRMFVIFILMIPVLLSMMPQKWWDRMETIQHYEQDASAMGRINAWNFAINLALDRPIVGGGYQTFTRELFTKYAPVPEDFHDAHSIYFEVLAEQGFVGLFLFLSVGIGAFYSAKWIIKNTTNNKKLNWAYDLASMLQVSVVGYAVGGTFLGLAYYDFYYHIVAMLILVKAHVMQTLSVENVDTQRCNNQV